MRLLITPIFRKVKQNRNALLALSIKRCSLSASERTCLEINGVAQGSPWTSRKLFRHQAAYSNVHSIFSGLYFKHERSVQRESLLVRHEKQVTSVLILIV